MDNLDFKTISNKTLVITGCNRGIGLAFASACAKKKANLILANRKADGALENRLLQEGAASVKTFTVDMSSRQSIDQLIEKLKNEKVNVLFNNAGLLTGGLLEEQTLDEIYNVFQVNITGLVHLTRGLLPQLLKQNFGKIINHASVTGVMHFPCATTYAATKAAVIAFSNSLNAELAGTGVSVLCLVTPGVKTRMFDDIEKKYGKNLKVPTDTIEPEVYAEKIITAIADGREHLTPTGLSGFGLFVAQHMPSLFRRAVNNRFRR